MGRFPKYYCLNSSQSVWWNAEQTLGQLRLRPRFLEISFKRWSMSLVLLLFFLRRELCITPNLNFPSIFRFLVCLTEWIFCYDRNHPIAIIRCVSQSKIQLMLPNPGAIVLQFVIKPTLYVRETSQGLFKKTAVRFESWWWLQADAKAKRIWCHKKFAAKFCAGWNVFNSITNSRRE